MGDSDDDYDRKRRDKFRGERGGEERGGGGGGGNGVSGGGGYRGGGGGDRRADDRGRGRDEWNDRGRRGPDYRDYRGPGGGVRDRFSPDRGGPPKRMRTDWGDEGRSRFADPYAAYGGGGGGWGHHEFGGGMHGGHGGGGYGGLRDMHGRGAAGGGVNAVDDNIQTQPPMMTLKQFLANQDDSISDLDAIAKYNEYKQEFRRQQLNEFFVSHKDEEWFKIKYHPLESAKRKEEQQNFLLRRANLFVEQMENGTVAATSVDTTQTEKLMRLLDTIVIKLEGGTDDDLKVLDEKPVEPQTKPLLPTVTTSTSATFATVVAKEPPQVQTTTSAKPAADEENWDDADAKPTAGEAAADPKPAAAEASDAPKSPEPAPKPAKKRSGDSESSSSSSSSSSSDSDSDDEGTKGSKTEPAKTEEKPAEEGDKATTDVEMPEQTVPNAAEQDGQQIGEQTDDASGEKPAPADAPDAPKPAQDGADAAPSVAAIETIDVDAIRPTAASKALHKTSSIFLRNLAPTITKAEVEAMCRRYPGFLRVAIADPLVERRWFRRGWVTFERDVNIKEICWNLNNIRLRDCELGAIVNRDLSRRVRPINGITTHKQIVRSDVKLCARITYNLDARAGLWVPEGGEAAAKDNNGNGSDEDAAFGLRSTNPVLQNITDYLIEEASAEEDELLGLSVGAAAAAGEEASGDGVAGAGEPLDRDPEMLAVLDRLILYLRVVHSVDFYNHCEYPYEDEMPNRCGIIHARGPAPLERISAAELQEYQRSFDVKMASFLAKPQPVPEPELKALGCKDAEGEVEKFVAANTQELAKDKWLCPLSGKKFKGPDFIRKHIFNKHAEKVDEVRKEVEYFNNYLRDPKRPLLPEHPGSRGAGQRGGPGGPLGGGERGDGGGAQGFRGGYHPHAGYGGVGAGGYGGSMMPQHRPRGGGYGGRRELPPDHSRRIVGYQDLDAPDYDFFP